MLEYIAPAQIQCNYLGLWTRNAPRRSPRATPTAPGSASSWWRAPTSSSRATKPAPDLHVNPYPNTAAPGQDGECEAGNERYADGQTIGNVPGNQGRTTEQTRPPAGVGQR